MTTGWIKDNIGESYDRAILDPWKATVFTAITGKYVSTRIHVRPFGIDMEAYAFLKDGSTNTTFLRENGISVLYPRVYEGKQPKNISYGSNNTDLLEVARNVYVPREVVNQ